MIVLLSHSCQYDVLSIALLFFPKNQLWIV
jgi:hypothetical protein